MRAQQRLAEDDNIAEKREEGDGDYDGGNELGRQNPDQEDAIAKETVTTEGVSGERRQRNGDEDCRSGDDDAVEDVGDHVAADFAALAIGAFIDNDRGIGEDNFEILQRR